ncbi:RhoGAP protein, partial [Rhizoctonia solani]
MSFEDESDWSDSDDGSQQQTSVLLGIPDGEIKDPKDTRDPNVSRLGGKPVRPSTVRSASTYSLLSYIHIISRMYPTIAEYHLASFILVYSGTDTTTKQKSALSQAHLAHRFRPRFANIRAFRQLRFNDKYAAKLQKRKERAQREKEREEAKIAASASGLNTNTSSNPFSMGGANITGPVNPFGSGFGGAKEEGEEEEEEEKGAREGEEDDLASGGSEDDYEYEDEPEVDALADKFTHATITEPSPAPTENEWVAHPFYPPIYLNTVFEYITPPKPAATSQKQAGEGGKGAEMWDLEQYERSSDEDPVFQRFAQRISEQGTQCIRYELGGTPLPFHTDDVYKKLFPPAPIAPGTQVPVAGPQPVSKPTYDPKAIPTCEHCKSRRIFECQLMPNVLNLLKKPSPKAKQSATEAEEARKKLVAAALGGQGGVGMEWGTCMVFACEKDCCDGRETWREEEDAAPLQSELRPAFLATRKSGSSATLAAYRCVRRDSFCLLVLPNVLFALLVPLHARSPPDWVVQSRMATTKAERRRTVMNTTTFDPSLLEQPPAPPPASANPSGNGNGNGNANAPTHPSASANTSKPSSRSSTQRQVSGGPAHSQKTLEQILANASPPGDMQNALTQLLDERNAVVQQNTQLWRIIEKQKASLAAATKDLDRIRAEREKYRRLFEETSGSGSEGRSKTMSKSRGPMARHQSDDVDLNSYDEPVFVSDDRDTTLTPSTRPPARSESLPTSTAPSKLSMTSAAEPTPPPAASSSLEPPIEPTSRAAKRESRIDFPDQTRQYIANMQSQNQNQNQDPPSDPASSTYFAPPPLPNVASVSPMNFDGAFAQHMVHSQPRPQDATKTPTQSSVTGFVPPPPPPPLPSRVPAESDEEFSADGHSSTVYSPAESNSKQALPTIIRNAPSIPQLNKRVNTTSIQTASLQSSMQEDTASFDSSPIATSPTTSTMSTPPPPKMQRTDSQQTTTTTSPPRLTPFDMGTAIITVPLSHIRANDRGKEVLSFVIEIALDPMSEREGWKIEKLYSDVLALDVKVRQTLSRSALKKIAPLPDAKLFKDNAPAKVDQRKMMLQAYLSSVLSAPWKNPADVTPFFTSDVILHARAPVSHPGYKEGYLTKRGKNFGGWKTRYFVLQSPVLEYYESRGGAHLGSIPLVGSQIGRQQRHNTRDNDDENAYRHAFLIIEGKRGPSGALNRHVLCAESDEERDAWVEVLVRYVVGEYDAGSTQAQAQAQAQGQLGNRSSQSQSRASTSSFQEQQQPRRTRAMSKDEILKGNALPISQLAQDASNAKLFQAPPPPPELGPKVGAAPIPIENRNTTSTAEQDVPLSSSLPSQLDVAMGQSQQPGQRSNSELGHYPDMAPPPVRKMNRASYHPSAQQQQQQQQYQERAPSPDKVRISGPMNGAPIPAGHRFGDSSTGAGASNERERKAKSGRFWGFGKAASDKPLPAPQIAAASRAVFGIPLQESLAISQIANLPAIVFRCIEYLEAKRADQEEGIYRLSGSSAVIKSLKDKFNAEGDVNLLESEEYWDPHAVAGLLKSYLRELPSSILTRDLHLNFLAVIDLADPQERVSELASLISQLPLANYSLLRALTAHLILIVQNSNVNKMTMRNVGIVFSPTLGIPAGVFSLMLNEFNRVFSVEAEGAPAPVEEAGLTVPPVAEATSSTRGKRGATDPSRRNSRSYNEAHADKLLGLAGRSLKVDEESDDDEGALEDNDHESEDETDHSGMFTTSPPQTPAAPVTGAARLEPPATDPHKGHSATVAASRGLHIAPPSIHPRSVSGPGLPQSPRPIRSPAGSAGSPATPRT